MGLVGATLLLMITASAIHVVAIPMAIAREPTSEKDGETLDRLTLAARRLRRTMSLVTIRADVYYHRAQFTAMQTPRIARVTTEIRPDYIALRMDGFANDVDSNHKESSEVLISRSGAPTRTYDYSEESVRESSRATDDPTSVIPQEISIFTATSYFTVTPLDQFIEKYRRAEQASPFEVERCKLNGRETIRIQSDVDNTRHIVWFDVNWDLLPTRKSLELLINGRWQPIFDVLTTAVQETPLGSFPKEVRYRCSTTPRGGNAASDLVAYVETTWKLAPPEFEPSPLQIERDAVAKCARVYYSPTGAVLRGVDARPRQNAISQLAARTRTLLAPSISRVGSPLDLNTSTWLRALLLGSAAGTVCVTLLLAGRRTLGRKPPRVSKPRLFALGIGSAALFLVGGVFFGHRVEAETARQSAWSGDGLIMPAFPMREPTLCGVDCLSFVLSLFEAKEFDYRTLMKLTNVGANGASMEDLAVAAECVGLSAEFIDISQMSMIPSPIIARHIREHYVVLVTFDGTDVVAFDPNYGIIRVPLDSLRGELLGPALLLGDAKVGIE